MAHVWRLWRDQYEPTAVIYVIDEHKPALVGHLLEEEVPMNLGGALAPVGIAVLVGLSGAAVPAFAAPLGSSFTYQGQLQQSGLPSDGPCDFQFSLWDAAGSGQPPAGGNQIGTRDIQPSVNVTNGLFTVTLSDASQFGAGAFAGDDRWLQIEVRCPAAAGSYTTLGPRQKLTAAPYAVYAVSAGSAADVSCTGCVSSNAIANGAITTSKIAGGTIQQSNLAFTPGSVMSVTAGAGLTGGTITTSGTIAANFGSAAGTVAEGNHTHFGQSWSGSAPAQAGLRINNFSSSAGTSALVVTQGAIADTAGAGGAAGLIPSSAGIMATSANGSGVTGETFDSMSAGVVGTAMDGIGVRGASTNGTGVFGFTFDGADGVYGESDLRGFLVGGNGVHGLANESPFSTGVLGESTGGTGVRGISTGGIGVAGFSSMLNGVFASSGGGTKNNAALRADNTNTTNGMAAYLTNNSTFATAHFANAGTGQVLWLQNGGTDVNGTGGGDFITCLNNPSNDSQFRVLTSGEARSDAGFNTPAADFAEMLPAADGLEPGDVLAVDADGQLTRSSWPLQTSVVGVYSTSPGFVGGKPMDGEAAGTVPLAVVGVVPVKASAENGPIHPGDLLAASATPGHAMVAGAAPAVGTVIGKSLGTLAGGTGLIRMIVTLQ
jgi:hypothetical protein